MIKVYPLSGNGQPIYYKKEDYNLIIHWGNQKIKISINIINDIINNYFTDSERWYPLGASMTNPVKGGLGEYIKNKYKNLNPRHATAIAAIMAYENLIETKDLKPILIRKIDK
jgi:hypothetical protein